jgi:hypothetical protein
MAPHCVCAVSDARTTPPEPPPLPLPLLLPISSEYDSSAPMVSAASGSASVMSSPPSVLAAP